MKTMGLKSEGLGTMQMRWDKGPAFSNGICRKLHAVLTLLIKWNRLQPTLVLLLVVGGTNIPALSQTARQELEAAIALWNQTYSHVAWCRGVVEYGSIATEFERQRIFSEMVEPQNVWMLSGEVSQPETLRLQRASDYPELVQSEEYRVYVDRVRSLVDQASLWFLVEWELPNDICVQTLVIADVQRVLYNSILSEAFYIENRSLTCLHAEARNFFGYGWKVGEVIVELNAICDPNTGCLINCVHGCIAWILIGVVERNRCSVTSAQDCCILNYDIVVRGGLWVRIFGVPIGIGSTFSANGSCVSCCRCRSRAPAPTPVPVPRRT
jgi:hypothetical protein